MEEWRDIEGYEGMYQVSNEGRIKSVGRVVMRNKNGKIFPVKVRESIMAPQSGVGMYRYIHLHKDNEKKAFRVHKLVWESFNGKVPDGLEIDHIIPVRNGGTDNLENLRIVTRSENHRNPLTVINRKKALKGRFSGELNPRYGVKVSDETKEKIRMKAIGRKYSEETKKKMSTPVYQCDEDGNIIKEWYGCAEAARYIGTNKCNIAKASKVGRMFKGFRWIRKQT